MHSCSYGVDHANSINHSQQGSLGIFLLHKVTDAAFWPCSTIQETGKASTVSKSVLLLEDDRIKTLKAPKFQNKTSAETKAKVKLQSSESGDLFLCWCFIPP